MTVQLRNRRAAITPDSETPRAALGRRLTKARVKLGATQGQVAIAAGVTPSAVGQWERGEKSIDLVNLILAAQFLNESIDYLVFGMRGKIEKRIAALPVAMRGGVESQVLLALETAEQLVKRNPKLLADDVVPDTDERLTQWSAADKIRELVEQRAAKTAKKKKPKQP